jgi:inosine triphosphate pyrophosphatase
VITEDTLCFNALNGLPGPYIKWFLESAYDGLNKMIEAFTDKTGCTQTIVAFCSGPQREHHFDGRTSTLSCQNRRVWMGSIFQPDEGGGKTYAEMNRGKGHISQRSRAFGQLKAYLLVSKHCIQSWGRLDSISLESAEVC